MSKQSETPSTPETTRTNEPFVEIAQDADGWHWQLWSGNGRPVAQNAVAYESRKHCLQAIKLLPGIWPNVKVIVKAG